MSRNQNSSRSRFDTLIGLQETLLAMFFRVTSLNVY